MKKLNVKQIKEQSIPILQSNDVEFAGIFGSYARNEAGKTSDIDLLIRFKKPKSLFDLVSLESKLSKVLGRKVDLVTQRALHPYIRDNVLGDLQVIYGQR